MENKITKIDETSFLLEFTINKKDIEEKARETAEKQGKKYENVIKNETDKIILFTQTIGDLTLEDVKENVEKLEGENINLRFFNVIKSDENGHVDLSEEEIKQDKEVINLKLLLNFNSYIEDFEPKDEILYAGVEEFNKTGNVLFDKSIIEKIKKRLMKLFLAQNKRNDKIIPEKNAIVDLFIETELKNGATISKKINLTLIPESENELETFLNELPHEVNIGMLKDFLVGKALHESYMLDMGEDFANPVRILITNIEVFEDCPKEKVDEVTHAVFHAFQKINKNEVPEEYKKKSESEFVEFCKIESNKCEESKKHIEELHNILKKTSNSTFLKAIDKILENYLNRTFLAQAVSYARINRTQVQTKLVEYLEKENIDEKYLQNETDEAKLKVYQEFFNNIWENTLFFLFYNKLFDKKGLQLEKTENEILQNYLNISVEQIEEVKKSEDLYNKLLKEAIEYEKAKTAFMFHRREFLEKTKQVNDKKASQK